MCRDPQESSSAVPPAHATEGERGGRPVRLCVLTTVGSSVRVHYQGRLGYFQAHGFDVTVVCASSEVDAAIRANGLRLVTIPMQRTMTPGQDLRALGQIWRFLRRERFELVEVGMPKAALLGAIAARLAGVPCVIHLLHGLSYEGQHGRLRRLLQLTTSVPCWLADQTYAVSPSVRERLHQDGVCDRARVGVLGSGSCNGVDLARMSPAHRSLGAAVRARCGIPDDALVLGYLGRFARDKGMIELATAFRAVSAQVPELWLFLVGDPDVRDPAPAEIMRFLYTHPRVRQMPWQTDPVPVYAAMNLLVLPTYREGMPVVLLEAAAMGLPSIATDATGARDALRDGVTGIQVPVGDAVRLAAAIERLARDGALRQAMGAAGRVWVEQHFDQDRLWALYAESYRRLAKRRRRGLSSRAASA